MNVIITDNLADGTRPRIGIARNAQNVLTMLEAAIGTDPRAECCGLSFAKNERTGWKAIVSHIDAEHPGVGDSLLEWSKGYGPFATAGEGPTEGVTGESVEPPPPLKRHRRTRKKVGTADKIGGVDIAKDVKPDAESVELPGDVMQEPPEVSGAPDTSQATDGPPDGPAA